MRRRTARQKAASRRNLARARAKKREKDGMGYWVAKGIRKAASIATFGASGMISEFSRKNGIKKKRRR
jgi:hypothetical protein